MKKFFCCLVLGLLFMLPAVSPAWSALLGSGTVTLDGTESLVSSVRVDRDGVESTWAVPKSFPGTVADNPTYFKTLSFAVGSPGNVEVSYQYVSGPGNIFVVAYANSFDVANLGTNYLGDSGQSVAASFPGPQTFQVTVPTGDSLVLAFNTVWAGGYLPGTVSYNVTGPAPVPVPPALLLFGPGLAGLAAIRRRFKA